MRHTKLLHIEEEAICFGSESQKNNVIKRMITVIINYSLSMSGNYFLLDGYFWMFALLYLIIYHFIKVFIVFYMLFKKS